MKHIIAFLFFVGFAAVSNAQEAKPVEVKQDANRADTMVVEAACGQCKFKLTGKGCDLAVRIDGKAYFVDGTDIDQHGDAHAKEGFCNAIRKAKVKGKVVNDRFKSTYFELVKRAER
jgi:hypothetical protein